MILFNTWAPEHLSKEDQKQVQRMLGTFFNPQALAICMKPIEVAVNLMKRTANKSPLYILSNWDTDSFMPFYDKYGRSVLEPVEKKHIVISAMTGYLKPQTGMYQYLLSKHNLDPKECLLIDDQKENVTAAQELGIAAWQFQEHHVHDLQEYLRQMYLV
jgi:HAD superfamily hydrolase (TIGR01509 family)